MKGLQLLQFRLLTSPFVLICPVIYWKQLPRFVRIPSPAVHEKCEETAESAAVPDLLSSQREFPLPMTPLPFNLKQDIATKENSTDFFHHKI